MKAIFYKVFFCFLTIFVSSLIQFYWAVGQFADQMSSACMTCSFFEDAIMMSLMISIFCATLFFFIFKLNNIYFKNCFAAVLLMTLWYYFDYSIFVERVSSWSTYSLNEAINVTTSLAFIPIVIMTFVCLFSIYFISKKSIKKHQR